MLITPTAPLVGEMPAGSEPRENREEEDLERPHPESARTGIISGAGTSDRRGPMTLARLNESAKAYWSRGKAA